MVSTFTPNINWEEPARGDDVGTWDTPVNNNGTLIDLVTGGIATIGLNNSNVTLSAAQFRSKGITFNSTLTGSVFITFPTTFTKSYEIQNLCSGSSAFVIVLGTTAAVNLGGTAQSVCVPPGETVDVFNDGLNLKFKNLGRIGSYWDYAGSSVPAWVSLCTVPPYLNCDGTSFSSATYPALAVVLAGTTLPDRRGTVGATINQGTGRMVNVINASSVGVIGGADQITLSAGAIPTITANLTVTPGGGIVYPINTAIGNFGGLNLASASIAGGPYNVPQSQSNAWGQEASMTGTMTSNNTGGGPHGNVQPTTVYGLSLIRAG